MRKYTSKFVATRLFTRLRHAACPFPGKYPLRLLWTAGGQTKYHGKFCAQIWRHVLKKQRYGLNTFLIYDKAGAILSGTRPLHLSSPNSQLLFRYFGTTWINGEHLKDVALESAGPYRLYLNSEFFVLDKPSFIHYVNSNIAHVRTV